MSTTEISVSSLEEAVGLAGHLRFLAELLGHLELDAESRIRWSAELGKIRARWEDPALCLAVLGEVSSGKSTLINALIRRPLLPTHALPAPVAVPILVRYGPQPRLRVDYRDGRSEQLPDDTDLAASVQRATSDLEVVRLTIDDPAPVLERGLVLFEIPGSQAGDASGESWDATLVTIPADIPVSETLIELLRGRLDASLHRVLFVVTRIDRVRPQERPRLLETIAGRLAAKLGLSSPRVLPVSALAALDEPLPDGTDANTPDSAGMDYRALQTELAATEERLVLSLTAQRSILLLERGAALVAAAFDRFAADLQVIGERARAERLADEEDSPHRLRVRVEEGRQRHGAALAFRLERAVDLAHEAIAATRQESLFRIEHLVARARGGEGLRAAIAQAKEVLSVLEGQAAPRTAAAGAQIEAVTREEIAAFAAGLPALPGAAETGRGETSAAGTTARDLEQLVRGGLTASASAVAARIRADQKKLIALLITATFIGFFAGLFFPPFIVAVPGLVLLLSPRGERRRRIYGKLLRSTIESSFARLDAAVGMRLAEALGKARQQLEETADLYFAFCDDLVQSRAAGETRGEKAARTERLVRGDLDDLGRRRQDLRLARTGLRQIQSL